MGHSCIVVDNKESRKHDLTEEIQKILRDGCMEIYDLPSVLGRVQYAELRIAGRNGKLALADTKDWEGHESPKTNILLDGVTKDAIEILLARLCSGHPKKFLADEPEKPILVFADGDGAVETNGPGEIEATEGGVIFVDCRVHAFGAHVDAGILQEWLCESAHLVGLTELYGVVIAVKVWKHCQKTQGHIFLRQLDGH